MTGTRDAPTVASISFHGVVYVAHQRRAGESARHLPRRAAHVDIDDVCAEVLREARTFRHPVLFTSCKLNDEGRQLLTALSATHHVGPFAKQRVACDHLGNNEPRAMCVGHEAEGLVCHARHGREKHWIAEPDWPD